MSGVDKNDWPAILNIPAEPEAPEVPPQPVDLLKQVLDELKELRELLTSPPHAARKGKPVVVCSNYSSTDTKIFDDKKVDVRGYNKIHFDVLVTGTTPSATITILGVVLGTPRVAVPDSNGTQAGVSATDSFVCEVGCQEIAVQISSLSGTFTSGQGFTVVVTPYVG